MISLLDMPGSIPTHLTGKQKSVLRLLKQGKKPAEIAVELRMKRSATTRLIQRAKLAEDTLRRAAMKYLEFD
jgi:DNA-binding CsgD family transcriptional regulator